MRIERWWRPGSAILVVIVAVLAYARLRVKLELKPDRITTCPNVAAEIDVRWRAPRTEIVEVYVYQIGQPPRLWTKGGSVGRARTGTWMGDGTTLMITDVNGRPLARKTMESITCPV